LKDVAKLFRSARLKDTMDRIEYFSSSKQNETEDLQGPVEADPEYLLIVEANNLAAQIDEEIGN
jgi:U4/U6 small nuclear ribonucleoprotein PRP31